MGKALLYRAASACLFGAIFLAVATVLGLAIRTYRMVRDGTDLFTLTLADTMTWVPFAELGALGALMGALTGKAGISILIALANALISGCEWCMKRFNRPRP